MNRGEFISHRDTSAPSARNNIFQTRVSLTPHFAPQMATDIFFRLRSASFFQGAVVLNCALRLSHIRIETRHIIHAFIGRFMSE